MKSSPIKATLKPAVAYYRTRVDDANAIDKQRRVVRGLAGRNGFKIIREYVDAAAEGHQLDRPGLLHLVADGGDADFVAILCVSLECLTTLPVEQSTWLFRPVRDNEVQIVTASRGAVDWREIVRPSLLSLDKQRRLVQRTRRRFARRDTEL